MYALKASGRIVAKANREFVGCLMSAFNRPDPTLTLYGAHGRVVLTAKDAASLSHVERLAVVRAAEQRIYEETTLRLTGRRPA